MAIDKIFNDANVDGIADNIFGAVNNSVSEVKQMQQRKAAENVQLVVEAFKKIETNITEKFDNVTDVIEKRVLTIKDGRDGSSGSDGRNGRDGKPGRDGVNGKQGTPGTPGKDGVDGVDGVSVTDANIDFDGSLVISLSTGQQINVGEIVPPELERQLVELRQGGGSAGSSGDVAGPTASTDNAIVRFDGTTGKLVQNSVVTIADTTGNMAGVGTLGAGAITATSLVSSGTAASSFTVTSGTAVPLTITNVGTGNSFVVEDSTNPDSTPFVIDNAGNVTVGNALPASGFGQFQVVTSSAFTSALIQVDSNASPSILSFLKTRGLSPSAQTIVQSGDQIGQLRFSGSDGVTYIRGAAISAEVDGTPGTNDMPGRLIFSTTADGASSPTERVRIDSVGNVGIGGTAAAGQTLSITKSITGAVTSNVLNNAGTIASDVTTVVRGYYSNFSTQAAAFTLANLQHFYANQSTIGATSVVTNQYGFIAESTLTGATANFGFFSNIAAAANRYNFYANGTAANLFAGVSQFAAGTAALPGITQISDLNTGIYFPAADTLGFTTGGTERMRIDSAGSVGIGSSGATGYSLVVAKSITGATSGFGVMSSGAIAADVTALTAMFRSQASNSSALTALYHYQAATPGGTLTSVTSQFGYYAETNLTGATNNYGVYSNIAAAANRYNFYAAGTAINYFSGVVQTNAATAIPAGGTAGAGVTVSSTANFGVFFGSGAPTLTAAKGSLYLRSDGSTVNDRMYVNTNGSTTWTNVVTSA